MLEMIGLDNTCWTNKVQALVKGCTHHKMKVQRVQSLQNNDLNVFQLIITNSGVPYFSE